MTLLHRSLLTLTSVATLVVLVPLGAGCGAGNENEGGAGGGAGANNPTSSGGNGFGDGGNGASFGSGAGTGTGGGCAGQDYVAEKAPLDMYIMLDQSGSMSDPPSGGNGSKWNAVTAGLTTFINQPAAAGIGVGIQYFPLSTGDQCSAVPFCATDADCGGPSCGPCMVVFPGQGVCVGGGDSCDAMDYATPDVEIGVLPANASPLQSSLGSHGPTGNTPTSAALQGAVDHAKAWATAHPGHVVVVVLATDGDPTSCNDDLAFINNIATTGLNGTPSVKTFVIGVGGSVGALNGIAAAGGTQQAFMIDQDPDVQTAFLDALNQIQGASLPCSYLIPPPPMGETIDYGKINFSYTPSGGTAQTVPRVDSAASCPANGLGWYYDDPNNPTSIVLCPSACSTISADLGGSVNIVVGCDTVVQ